MNTVAIFSPAAGGNVGHGFIYAYKLCNYLKTKKKIQLFTIDDPEKTKEFIASGIPITLSKKFEAGRINKKRFNRLRLLKNPVYGIYRIHYNYKLIKEFYQRLDNYKLFHLFEFEYVALLMYSILHRKELRRTILGIHIADFKWIKGRPLSVNIYKSLLKRPVSWMLRNSLITTTHGESTKSLIMQNLSLPAERIASLQYGCEIKVPELTKQNARKVIGLDHEKRIIALFFGVFRSDKGLIDVINSLSKIHKDIVLLIAGSEGNITFKEVTEAIRNNDLENRTITVFKYFNENEIKFYYYASDFVLIPHKGEHLAFSGPLSLSVEYCRPVLASNVGEIGDFVRRNKIGMTFTPDNMDNFIETANSFYKGALKYNDEHFVSVQKNNSWEEMGKQIDKLYNNYIK